MEHTLDENETHDYESLTTVNGRNVVVNLGEDRQRKTSHAYACIGEAPSMDELPSPDSPPFIPEGGELEEHTPT